MILTIAVLVITSVLVSAALLGVYLPIAKRANLLDIPNHRSSHSSPKIRGAGISFSIAFNSLILVYHFLGHISEPLLIPLLLGGVVVSTLGFIDDYADLNSLLRLIMQFLVAVSILYYMTDAANKNFVVQFIPHSLVYLSFTFGILFIVWMINLFNFMDGVDGIAASQSVLVALSSAAASYIQGSSELTICYSLLALTLLPFLKLNWQPAKFFMGDSGAYFLGFTFAALAVYGKIFHDQNLFLHYILLGAFISDATTTLLVRLVRGEKVWKAHRSHGFQKLLTKHSWSHKKISSLYALITVFWFLPLSFLTLKMPYYSMGICLIAYAPFIFFLFTLKTGFDD